MLKMYSHTRAAGGAPEFWDTAWSGGVAPSELLFNAAVCENDPIFPLLRDTVQPGRLFLEGGCGQAQWVKYLSDRGHKSVGIDFAARTVEAVKQAVPALDVRLGNILALPFADGEVHTYYSGGVVEHFESGPEPALAEARRVLAADGWLLCSVPDQSPLRSFLFRRPAAVRDEHLVRPVERTAEEPAPAGMQFFQYVFTEAEFRRRLEDAGFRVERTFGYAIVWGLTELPGIPWLLDSLQKISRRRKRTAGAPGVTAGAAAAHAPASAPAAQVGLLRRALVREDPTTPLFGPALRLLSESCANMRMYVARPAGR